MSAINFMQFVQVTHPAATNAQVRTQQQQNPLREVVPFDRQAEMSRFRAMAFEDALINLLSMQQSSSEIVGGDQLRELNSNLD